MRYVLAVETILAILLVTMADAPKTKPTYSPTKIPYNNGFYAGPYNPKLPIIDPNSK